MTLDGGNGGEIEGGANMFYMVLLAASEGAETIQKSIFASPFFPKQLSFSDVLGIVSVALAIISIVLAIVIYKLSNDTSEKLAEEAARRAFEKRYNAEGALSEKSSESMSVTLLSKEQCKAVKRVINQIIKRAKKNSITDPWVHAAIFPIQLKSYFSEEDTVRLMYEWKDKGFISWTGTLENFTKILILKGELLIENINSR